MQNKGKTGLIIAIIVVIFIAVSYSGKTTHSDSPVIKIGGISALTGVGNSIGEEERKGAQLAVDEINSNGGVLGAQLQLVSEDLSIDKIKNAGAVVNKLISVDKVVAIVGAQWDEPTVPILPIIEQAQVPMIGADNSDQLELNKDYKYFFSTWYDNRVGIKELLEFSQTKGYKNIAIIKPISAGFWEFTANEFTAHAPEYGINITDTIDMGNPLSVDFKTHILKIKKNNPDAIFIVTSDYNQCTFQKQLKENGLNIPTLGTESSGDPSSLANCSKLLETRFFSTPKQTKEYSLFADKFKDKYGEAPRFPSAVTAYDAVFVIAQALKETKLHGGAELQKTLEIISITGAGLEKIKFNSKGFVVTPDDAFEMKTTLDGKFVPAI